MSASRLRIVTGAIYHLGTGSLADLDVEVWMQASSSKSFLTRATTDSTGKFTLKIPMGRGEVRRALKQGTLTLRVYRDKLEMPVGTGTLSWSTPRSPSPSRQASTSPVALLRWMVTTSWACSTPRIGMC